MLTHCFRRFLLAVVTLGVWNCTTAFAVSDQLTEYRLEPVWEVVDDGKQPFMFGVLEDLLIDAGGNLFVLDSQLVNIKVFSPNGDYMRTLGRPGEGPGEFRAVGSLSRMPDGSLGVVSKMLAKIHKIDSTTGYSRGTFVGEGADGPGAFIGRAKYEDSLPENSFVALVSEMRREFWSSRLYLALFYDPGNDTPTPPLTEIAVVGQMNGVDNEEEEYYRLWSPWTIDALGRIVLAPYWGVYQIRYCNPHGDVLQDVSFPFQHRKRTSEEKQRLLHLMWGGESPARFGVELELSETEAVVRELYPRPNGDIWIRTNRSGDDASEGVFLTLDSVSPAGEMNGKVRIHGAGDESIDRIFFGNDDRVIIIQGAEGFVRTARGKVKTEMVYDLKLVAYDLVEIE